MFPSLPIAKLVLLLCLWPMWRVCRLLLQFPGTNYKLNINPNIILAINSHVYNYWNSGDKKSCLFPGEWGLLISSSVCILSGFMGFFFFLFFFFQLVCLCFGDVWVFCLPYCMCCWLGLSGKVFIAGRLQSSLCERIIASAPMPDRACSNWV